MASNPTRSRVAKPQLPTYQLAALRRRPEWAIDRGDLESETQDQVLLGLDIVKLDGACD
jgi:hypothetical protein